MLHTVSIILFIIGMVTSQQDFGSSGCGCCPDPLCPTASPPCSSNVDCACLFMTMTSGGMCANTVVSCNNLTRCNSDNVTCSVPNTVCVNNTRCNIPVCYPIELASYQQCPAREAPISTTTTTTVFMTTSTTTSTATTRSSTTSTTTTRPSTTSTTTTRPSTTTTSTASSRTTATTTTTITINILNNTCTQILSGAVVTLLNLTNVGSFNYTRYQYTYTAVSSKTTMMMIIRQDPSYWCLDDISVTNSGGAQLWQNGGFEQSPLTQYYVYCNPNNASASGVISTQCPHLGSNNFYDGSVSYSDYLSQSFTTVRGATYNVNFWLSNLGSPQNNFIVLIGG
ncbi:unnamed protein product [Rotaria magnacalcarata]|uniref:Uncharacterized protein n=1 Tax=Rotaria magnacalcarata TaxID=392030 RepID=A0A816PCG4_9BILA|nr:unnamed protein product [Rotaria magnacalcarata]